MKLSNYLGLVDCTGRVLKKNERGSVCTSVGKSLNRFA